MDETRHEITEASAEGVRVLALDSNALVAPDDVGHIVVTGSHGGLLGGRIATAVKHDVFAAIYNDADFGIDNAGISRLPALGARNIAGATVSAWSARIGDGRSTYRDGYVTAVNGRAARCGAEIGISAVELVVRLVAARAREPKK
jgi:protein involved in polysaccharide export with SLBB domain